MPKHSCDCLGRKNDCSGVCGGTHCPDECGVCNGPGIVAPHCDCFKSTHDCMGVCGGSAKKDNCGVCNGVNLLFKDKYCDCQ